jgi:hypothetical protein
MEYIKGSPLAGHLSRSTPSALRSRSLTRSKQRTPKASFIATSSPQTSWSPTPVSNSWISVWRSTLRSQCPAHPRRPAPSRVLSSGPRLTPLLSRHCRTP